MAQPGQPQKPVVREEWGVQLRKHCPVQPVAGQQQDTPPELQHTLSLHNRLYFYPFALHFTGSPVPWHRPHHAAAPSARSKRAYAVPVSSRLRSRHINRLLPPLQSNHCPHQATAGLNLKPCHLWGCPRQSKPTLLFTTHNNKHVYLL